LLEDIYTGIAFLFIQIPYLVLALLAFLDNPELLKKLAEWNNTSMEWLDEYFGNNKVPTVTELAPIEYNFEQFGLDASSQATDAFYNSDYETKPNPSRLETKEIIDEPIATGLQEAISKSKDVANNIKHKATEYLDSIQGVEDRSAQEENTSSAQNFNYTDDYLIDAQATNIEQASNVIYKKADLPDTVQAIITSNEIKKVPVNNYYKEALQSPNIYDANNRDNYKIN
jgi:hypothetical protein